MGRKFLVLLFQLEVEHGEESLLSAENDYSYVAFIPGVLIPGWLDHTGMAPNRLTINPDYAFQEVFNGYNYYIDGG